MKTLRMEKNITVLHDIGNITKVYEIKYRDLPAEVIKDTELRTSYSQSDDKRRAKQLNQLGFELAEIEWMPEGLEPWLQIIKIWRKII